MDWHLIAQSIPKLLSGALMTVFLTVVSAAAGGVLALLLAIAQISGHAVVRMPASWFVTLFRGTPMLLQLFIVYYGLGQYSETLRQIGLWVIFRDELSCALIVLSCNTAAYSAEIFRGAILAVPRGQLEGAKALGLGRVPIFARVVWPQAFRLALPAYTNELVFLMQATSLVALITVTDLFRVSADIAKRSFAVYEMYLSAALFYLVISYAIIYVFGRFERRLSRHMVSS